MYDNALKIDMVAVDVVLWCISMVYSTYVCEIKEYIDVFMQK